MKTLTLPLCKDLSHIYISYRYIIHFYECIILKHRDFTIICTVISYPSFWWINTIIDPPPIYISWASGLLLWNTETHSFCTLPFLTTPGEMLRCCQQSHLPAQIQVHGSKTLHPYSYPPNSYTGYCIRKSIERGCISLSWKYGHLVSL